MITTKTIRTSLQKVRTLLTPSRVLKKTITITFSALALLVTSYPAVHADDSVITRFTSLTPVTATQQKQARQALTKIDNLTKDKNSLSQAEFNQVQKDFNRVTTIYKLKKDSTFNGTKLRLKNGQVSTRIAALEDFTSSNNKGLKMLKDAFKNDDYKEVQSMVGIPLLTTKQSSQLQQLFKDLDAITNKYSEQNDTISSKDYDQLKRKLNTISTIYPTKSKHHLSSSRKYSDITKKIADVKNDVQATSQIQNQMKQELSELAKD